ncbi:hypothetical protein [Arthrobacter sp. StoSoilB5]|uniref:hypothetical protein n=1 Tax=Arthrobacter sp. StoSoilB5 TaxID=2830992 RepID=UPI001CC62C3E|nr:hypothetical protein [Arthrobacter sp. StoSoilB5]BCW46607.1 hypothetical protein StoSoilB5_37910 [Arthrobacter sp. StoSoilB5]
MAFDLEDYPGRTNTNSPSEIGVVDGESAKFRTHSRTDSWSQDEIGANFTSDRRAEADRQGVFTDFDSGLGEVQTLQGEEQQVGWEIRARFHWTKINAPPPSTTHLLEGVEHQVVIHVQYFNLFNQIEQREFLNTSKDAAVPVFRLLPAAHG